MELRNFKIPKHVYIISLEGQRGISIVKSLDVQNTYLKDLMVSEEIYNIFKLDRHYPCVLPSDLLQALEKLRPCFKNTLNLTIKVFKLEREPFSASRSYFIFSETSLDNVLERLRDKEL